MVLLSVLFSAGYTLPAGDEPLTHARIAHSLNWLAGGTAAASTTAFGFDADAPLNTLTYEFWKPTAYPATWTYSHGSTVTIDLDYCFIAAHNLGTSGASITIQYDSTGGGVWVDLTASTLITDDSPIFVIFPPGSPEILRVQIDSYTDAPQIGVIKFGASMQMERPLYGGHAPISLARQTILRSNYSETGENLGRTKQRTYLATSYAWQHLTAAWVRSTWRTFQLAAESEPFCIAWRPGTFTEDAVGFAQIDEVPIPTNMGIRDLMSVSMSVRARGYE